MASRDQCILTDLESIQRNRALTLAESVMLERALSRVMPRKREIWRWSATEDRRLVLFIKRRARVGYPRPYERNDEVRIMAEDMGRSYWAVIRRMERLRKVMKGNK